MQPTVLFSVPLLSGILRKGPTFLWKEVSPLLWPSHMASSQSISIEPILLPSLSLKALPLSSAASPHIFPDRCYTHPFHSYFHFFAQHVPALQRVPCIYMTPTRHSRSVQASHILKSSLMTPGLSGLGVPRRLAGNPQGLEKQHRDLVPVRAERCEWRTCWWAHESFPKDPQKHCGGGVFYREPEGKSLYILFFVF